jgi:hypothetical protein
MTAVGAPAQEGTPMNLPAAETPASSVQTVPKLAQNSPTITTYRTAVPIVRG